MTGRDRPDTGREKVGQTDRGKLQPWSSRELEQLRRHAHEGADYIAAMLGRTVKSVRRAAERHRISLRRRGERRGILLGQPAGTSWEELRRTGVSVAVLRRIREEAIDGTLDLGELERRIREVTNELEAPLCPRCSRRPQTTRTGLCESCHLRELARAHRDEHDRRDAQRELWRERQQKVRGQ